MDLENIRKRFGEIAIEKGFITEEQLHEGLSVQRDDSLKRLDHRLIGIILYQLGYMEAKQIITVLNVMETISPFEEP